MVPKPNADVEDRSFPKRIESGERLAVIVYES